MRFWLALVLLILLMCTVAAIAALHAKSGTLQNLSQIRWSNLESHFDRETLILLKLAGGLFVAQAILLFASALQAMRWSARHARDTAAVRQSERFARATLDAIDAQIAIIEESGAVAAVNKAWQQFSVGGSDQIIERVPEGQNFLAMCDAATGQRSAEAAAIAQAIRKVLSGQSEAEWLESAGHSERGDAWYICRVHRFPGDGPPRAVTLFEDITARKAAETQVQRAREYADAANASKSAFLANMSHEIRTPMTAILGYAELMQEGHQTAEKREHCLRIIRRNGEHLLALINDILDLSKIEADKLTLELLPTDLTQLIGDVALLMRHRAEQRKLAFRVVFDGAIPRQIQTDPVRLRQVLINLLSNAIKFTQQGGVTLRVACQETLDNSVIHFDVIDSGVGMDDQQLARLFQPFMQGDQSTTRRFGGTGLGLSISRKLAKLLGGDVSVQSMPGIGSMFSVWVEGGSLQNVPRIAKLSEDDLVVAGPAPRVELQLKGRVLLAEDGEDNRELLCAILKDAGVEVDCAENGRIAFELAMQNGYDLILMDMQMPELDGYTATRKLRECGLKAPIIALTAHAMTDDRRRCLDAGCDEYCSKPIDRNLLIATMGKLLGAQPAAVAEDSQRDTTSPVRSTRADDPKMAAMLAKFVDRLPQRVSEIAALLQREQTHELERALHQLKGAAGGYGFPEISEQAGKAEMLLRTQGDLEKFADETRRLIALIERVDGYSGPVVEKPKPSKLVKPSPDLVPRGQPQDGSRIDLATNLPNRRYMEERMSAELSISRRVRKPFVCAAIKLTQLREIRQRDGEKAADELLGLAARTIGPLCGDHSVGRWDDDQFVILMLGQEQNAAESLVYELASQLVQINPALTTSTAMAVADMRATDSDSLSASLEAALSEQATTASAG